MRIASTTSPKANKKYTNHYYKNKHKKKPLAQKYS